MPEDAGVSGKCHICQETKEVWYCNLCDHWFCDPCSKRWFLRGLMAMKQAIVGKWPGCCGPTPVD